MATTLQLYEVMSSFMVATAKTQQTLQALKSTLTSYSLFNPYSLYSYLANGQPILTTNHLKLFLETNGHLPPQLSICSFIPSLKSLSRFDTRGLPIDANIEVPYEQFLRWIYPYTHSALREAIGKVPSHLARLNKVPPHLHSINAFYALISFQIAATTQLYTQKSDSLSSVPFQRLQQSLRSIKKAAKTNKLKSHTKLEPFTVGQLNDFLKAFSAIGENQLFCLVRKIGLNKDGTIDMGMLEGFFKLGRELRGKCKDTDSQFGVGLAKQSTAFNQEQYKNKLLEEFHKGEAFSLEINAIKPIQIDNKASKQVPTLDSKLYQPKQRIQQNYELKNNQQVKFAVMAKTETQKHQAYSIKNYKANNQTSTKENLPQQKQIVKGMPLNQQKQINQTKRSSYQYPSPNRLLNATTGSPKEKEYSKHQPISITLEGFLLYVQSYLGFSKPLQPLHSYFLSLPSTTFLSVFKQIDEKSKGVVSISDLRHFFVGVESITMEDNFEGLIKHYSYQGEQWLSLSEFMAIFRMGHKPQQTFNSQSTLKEMHTRQNQVIKKMGTTLSLIMKRQKRLEKLALKGRPLSEVLIPPKLLEMFESISKTDSNFINYQQLKRWLSSAGMTLSMQDTMTILKRIDKGRNGVVLRNDFIRLY